MSTLYHVTTSSTLLLPFRITHVPQRSAARLVQDLSRHGGVQVLCVSHNKAFQQACDTLVHVSRNAAGSSIAEDASSGKPAGAVIAGSGLNQGAAGGHAGGGVLSPGGAGAGKGLALTGPAPGKAAVRKANTKRRLQ